MAGISGVVTAREADKYRRMWAVDDYRTFSPGEEWLPMFLSMAGEARGTLIDIGCGTGRAGQQLAERGFDVTLYDLVPDAVDVDGLPFRAGSLWDIEPCDRDDPYDWGYCCDVMEHVPMEFTMLSLARMLEACQRVFLTIATEPDQFGVRVGEPLHLTIQPFTWWRDRLRELGDVHEARDCLNTSVFLVASCP